MASWLAAPLPTLSSPIDPINEDGSRSTTIQAALGTARETKDHDKPAKLTCVN
jgi:hypothetical protein